MTQKKKKRNYTFKLNFDYYSRVDGFHIHQGETGLKDGDEFDEFKVEFNQFIPEAGEDHYEEDGYWGSTRWIFLLDAEGYRIKEDYFDEKKDILFSAEQEERLAKQLAYEKEKYQSLIKYMEYYFYANEIKIDLSDKGGAIDGLRNAMLDDILYAGYIYQHAPKLKLIRQDWAENDEKKKFYEEEFLIYRPN